MRKIVINRAIGGFCLSDEAFEAYLNALNIKFIKKTCGGDYWDYLDGDGNYLVDDQDNNLNQYNVPRADSLLVSIVEELGGKSGRDPYSLKVVEIPEDVNWYIYESNAGIETVHEVHRVWS